MSIWTKDLHINNQQLYSFYNKNELQISKKVKKHGQYMKTNHNDWHFVHKLDAFPFAKFDAARIQINQVPSKE